MTAKVYALLATIGLAMILAGAAVPAQAGPAIVAAIPFDFVVGNKTLPAGKYRIQRAVNSNPRLLVFENVERPKVRAVVSTTPGDLTPMDGTEMLVFNRYGNEHFLSAVGLRGLAVGNVHMSKAEEQLAKSGVTREQVSLTMSPR